MLIQLGTHTRLAKSDDSVPRWNTYRPTDLEAAISMADALVVDDGFICIVHSGSFVHTGETFDYLCNDWADKYVHLESFTIWNETPCYMPTSSKEVRCHDSFPLLALIYLGEALRWNHNFVRILERPPTL